MTLAGESQMDEAAERLGLDPLELRRRNVLRAAASGRGRTVRGIDADLPADLDLAAEELGWGTPLPAGPWPGDLHLRIRRRLGADDDRPSCASTPTAR